MASGGPEPTRIPQAGQCTGGRDAPTRRAWRERYDARIGRDLTRRPGTTSVAGVVYQASDSSNSESFSFISGSYESDKEDRFGFSLESSILFPFYREDDNTFDRDFTDVSLFGLTLANTASVSDTTWASVDPVNFQVYAIRPKNGSRNAYFKLTSSVSPNPFPENLATYS